jgi:DNA-binding transcriptional MerR regulator
VIAVRIGELAREAGTTPRTVRYYEEIRLLPSAGGRAAGAHREYGSADLERVLLILRLKDLLGLSLEELREVVRGEDARSVRRREWLSTSDPAARTRILEEAGADVDRLLELVARRRDELETLERELLDRRDRVRAARTA